MTVVLDASVVAKWFFEENNSRQAFEYLNLHKQNKLQVSVPKFLLLELGNTFLNKKVFDQKFFPESISALFLAQLDFIDIDDTNILNSIFALAGKHQLTFYDAAYIACARRLHCDFITADKKLYSKTKSLKFVKMLGTRKR